MALTSVVLVASFLVAGCESVAGREEAACHGNPQCVSQVRAKWAAWANAYGAGINGGAYGSAAPGLNALGNTLNPQSNTRSTVYCQNAGAGVVSCYGR